jgi:diaminopimelate epimerase
MHGLGNDFIVIDNRDGSVRDAEASALALKLCERHMSVGADGVLFLSNSNVADVRMQTFNSDGSEAEMCGNGIRCFAKYCYENGVVRKKELNVETMAGVKHVWLNIEKDSVTAVKVDMGVPEWEKSKIPMLGQGTFINGDLRVDEENYKATCVSMGNPHCVVFVENVEEFPVEYVGPMIAGHEFFPKKTNVEFVQVLNRNELQIRVLERGCGETLACGTGACASAAAANRLGKVDNKVKVHLRGGDLTIEIGEHVFMTGPAEKVFEGKLF